MLEKDKTYTRDVHMMENHPHLQPKMRAILLDWLMEVCKLTLVTIMMPRFTTRKYISYVQNKIKKEHSSEYVWIQGK